MGSKNDDGVQETSQQRALMDIGKKKMENWRKVWFPIQQRAGAEAIRSMDPAGAATQHAVGMATSDTAARFAQVPDVLNKTAAQRGGFGGSAHKLALVGAGADSATSMGTAATEAQQDVQDAATANVGGLLRLANGQESTAINGLARSASISAQRAAADAESSLARRTGDAQLAGQVIGAGLGAYASMDAAPAANTNDYRGTILPNELRGGR